MKHLFLTCTMLGLFATWAAAAVTITPLDPAKNILRVSYEISDNDRGVKSFVFPPEGFDFADGPIVMRGAYVVDSGAMLESRVLTLPTGKQAIEVIYPAPIAAGQFYKTRFTFDVPTKNFQVEPDGRWTVRYSTGHELFFLVPEGHRLVHAEPQISLEEVDGRVIANFNSKMSDHRGQTFIFQTRPLR